MFSRVWKPDETLTLGFEIVLKLVLNIGYAVERCFVNGRIVNKNVRIFLGSLAKYISEAAKVTSYEP